jgi:hypothetical protein
MFLLINTSHIAVNVFTDCCLSGYFHRNLLGERTDVFCITSVHLVFGSHCTEGSTSCQEGACNIKLININAEG